MRRSEIIGLLNLLEQAVKHGTRKIIFASSFPPPEQEKFPGAGVPSYTKAVHMELRS